MLKAHGRTLKQLLAVGMLALLVIAGLACDGPEPTPPAAVALTPTSTVPPAPTQAPATPSAPEPTPPAAVVLAPTATVPPAPTRAPEAPSVPEPTPTPVPASTPAATATPTPEVESDDLGQDKFGYSDDPGILSPYVKPAEIDGAGRKLLAIYMVGSDLEENPYLLAGTTDLKELIIGYVSLPDNPAVEVVVAFGGSRKDGWRGMKLANIAQLLADVEDGEFGNETGANSYLYQADGAHMGDESSLKLFLDYLRDGYVNFDQTFLTFWDHGASYTGFGNDTNFNHDPLRMDEIEGAFRRSRPGTFDLVGFDACLMASVEVAKIIEPHAKYMIASEELEPGHGWQWTAVVQQYALTESTVEAGEEMIDYYVQDVHGSLDGGKTLSLLDLSQYDDLVTALNPVVSAYGGLLYDEAYSDSLIFGSTGARSYGVGHLGGIGTRYSIDLMHFTQLLAENLPDTDIGPSLSELAEAIDRFVVHSNHDGSRPNSFGIAIAAPENAEEEYSAYKINDTWLDFQGKYKDFRLSDTVPPIVEVVPGGTNSDRTLVTVHDENLSRVMTAHGFVHSFKYGDGTVEDLFRIVTRVEARPHETDDDVYSASTWDQWWLEVEYDPEERLAWIPASFTGFDGQGYGLYNVWIHYYQAGKDYRDYEFPYDPALLTLTVDEHWEVVNHSITPYKVLFTGPDDEEGTIQLDKANLQIAEGDAVQFWHFAINLEDKTDIRWLEASEVVTFVQEPDFQYNYLWFHDAGERLEHHYAILASDVAKNFTLSDPIPAPWAWDSPLGNMMVFEDPSGYFKVPIPWDWIEREPDSSQDEVFKAYTHDESGSVRIFIEEGGLLSLTEFVDQTATGLLEAGAEAFTRTTVQSPQGLAAIIFEFSIAGTTFFALTHLAEDGTAYTILYAFAADQSKAGMELAEYSFDAFHVN